MVSDTRSLAEIPEGLANKHQVDGVSNYIDWAVGEGFGVMDINVPGYARQPDGVSLRAHHWGTC